MRKTLILIILLASFLTLNAQTIDEARKLNNAPTPSSGYGKELGDFKSGTYTMTSADLERKYTIDIPEDYDKNKTYRLIFTMHMMGGNMQTMVDQNFYGLKTYAEKDGVDVIFVAPEGYTDRSPWRGRDNKDHIFFADMLELFKDKFKFLNKPSFFLVISPLKYKLFNFCG